MKRMKLAHVLAAAAALAGFVACQDALGPIADADLAAELASSAGDAMASDVNEAVANEVFGGFSAPAVMPSAAADSVTHTWSATRTRTCYNAGAVVTCGQGTITSVKITLTIDGSRTGPEFSGAIHHTRTDSIGGVGQGSTARIHNGRGTSADTTSFTRDSSSRKFAETGTDSIIALTFNLPHSSNPWPVSGQVIRNVNANITITGKINQTRTISRRVVITFPADAQGNVPIQVGTTTCSLNLVTHKVTGCTG